MSDEAQCGTVTSKGGRSRIGGGEILLFLAVILAALAFRCYRLAEEPLWHDETASIKYLDEPSFGAFVAEERPGDPAMVPLYFYLEYQCWKLTGGSVMALRVMSVIFGMVTVLVTYALARRIFGPPAALTAGGCAAVAIQQVYYSQEIRMYALFAMAAAVAMYGLLRILRGDHSLWWAVLGIANAVMLWTHLHGVWLVLVQGAFVFAVRRSDFKALSLWAAVHGPLLLSVFMWISTTDPEHVNAHLGWIPDIFSDGAKEFIADSALSVTDGSPSAASPDRAYLATNPSRRWDESLYLPTATKILIAVLWLALTTTATVRGLRKRRRLRAEGDPTQAKALGTDLGLMLAWWLAPGAILIFLSLVWRPTALPRYVLHSTVALYVLMGGGVAMMRSRRWQRFIGCLLVGLYAYDTAAFGLPRRPNVRDAMAIVEQEPFNEGDMVFIHPSGYGGPARYYGTPPDSAIASYREWEDMPDRALEVAAAGHDAWLVVGALMGTPPDPGPQLLERGLEFKYEVVPGAFMLRVYHVLPLAPRE